MATSPHPTASAGHGSHHRVATRTFSTSFPCLSCAEAVERALRAQPHITGVHVDYPGQAVHVTFHEGMVDEAALQRLISDQAHGCRCAPAGDEGSPSGGGLNALAHTADMAAVTMGTHADRMQYEFPATAAGRAHDQAEHEEVKDLADDIMRKQTAEVGRMNAWPAAWYGL